jgi:putative zinc finger/helix-turn-helix YgiT family protein
MDEFISRELNCPNCQAKHKTKIGEYHYTESGLPNVWLLGVELFECDCGESFAFIPCIQELHQLLAKILLTQENPLSGPEIRFLRKTMGLKAKEFAYLIGVKNITVSRWERGGISPPNSIDRFIRLFYATNMNLPDLAKKLAHDTFRKPQKKQGQIIRFPIERLTRDTCLVNPS